MTEFSSLTELEKYLNGVIRKSLDSNVAEVAKETMQSNIEKDVYEPYKPYSTDNQTPHYQRTGQLLKDVEHSMVNDNTMVIEDTRNKESDVESGRDIIKVIEEGKGYLWGYKRNLDQEIGPRPFVQDTFNDLEKGLAVEAMKKGLKSQGLNVE